MKSALALPKKLTDILYMVNVDLCRTKNVSSKITLEVLTSVEAKLEVETSPSRISRHTNNEIQNGVLHSNKITAAINKLNSTITSHSVSV